MKEISGPKTFLEIKTRQTKMSEFISATVATGVEEIKEEQKQQLTQKESQEQRERERNRE